MLTRANILAFIFIIFAAVQAQSQSVVTEEQCTIRLREASFRLAKAHASLSSCMRDDAVIGPGETCDLVSYNLVPARLKAWPHCDRYEGEVCSAGKAKESLSETCARLHKVTLAKSLTDTAKEIRTAASAAQKIAKFDSDWGKEGFLFALKQRAASMGVRLATTVGGEAISDAIRRRMIEYFPSWNPDNPGSMSADDRRRFEYVFREAKRALQMKGNAIQDVMATAVMKELELTIDALDQTDSLFQEFKVEYQRTAPVEKRYVPPTPPPAPRVERSRPAPTRTEVDPGPMDYDDCADEVKNRTRGLSESMFRRRCDLWISRN
jgi:hypothetical protein